MHQETLLLAICDYNLSHAMITSTLALHIGLNKTIAPACKATHTRFSD